MIRKSFICLLLIMLTTSLDMDTFSRNFDRDPGIWTNFGVRTSTSFLSRKVGLGWRKESRRIIAGDGVWRAHHAALEMRICVTIVFTACRYPYHSTFSLRCCVVLVCDYDVLNQVPSFKVIASWKSWYTITSASFFRHTIAIIYGVSITQFFCLNSFHMASTV